MKAKLAQFDKHASMVLLCFMMDLLLLVDKKSGTLKQVMLHDCGHTSLTWPSVPH